MAWEENSRICLHMQLIAILSRIGVDNQSCDKMILLSKQIKDTVYLRLLLKENWTKSEMQTLLIEMFAYDAAIATRPLKL